MPTPRRRSAGLFALFLTVLPLSGGAASPPAPPTRITGTVDRLDGRTLQVNSASGLSVSLPLGEGVSVIAVEPSEIAAIRAGQYVGMTVVPQPDGTMKALEVHIFPESMRGIDAGVAPWNHPPHDAMINGTVNDVVGRIGRSITLIHGDAEEKIVIPPHAPVVICEPADAAALVSGAHVIVFAEKSGGDVATANRIIVGKSGLVPPM